MLSVDDIDIVKAQRDHLEKEVARLKQLIDRDRTGLGRQCRGEGAGEVA